MNLHTSRVYNHTRYDITGYFRLAVIVVKTTVERLRVECLEKGLSDDHERRIVDNQPHKPAEYDVTATSGWHSWKSVKTVENAADDDFGSNFWRTI